MKHFKLRTLPWSRGKPSDIHPTTVVFCYICGSNPGLGRIFYFRFRKDYGKTSLIKIASIINAVIWYFNRFSVTIQTKNLIFGKIRHSKSSGVLFLLEYIRSLILAKYGDTERVTPRKKIFTLSELF